MAVRIRMKKLGRKHRPFFRICVMDKRAPRDGRVIEELGYYDPMCKETDARVSLKAERIDYWLGVGAQPSDKCAVLIKKYGSSGTHLPQQQEAFNRLQIKPQAPAAVPIPLATKEPAAAEAPTEVTAAASADEVAVATPTEEAAAEEVAAEEVSSPGSAAEAAPAETAEASTEEAPADEKKSE